MSPKGKKALRLVASGSSQAEAARATGLSRQRVHQLVMQDAGRCPDCGGPKGPGSSCRVCLTTRSQTHYRPVARRRRSYTCLACGGAGHQSRTCPERKP